MPQRKQDLWEWKYHLKGQLMQLHRGKVQAFWHAGSEDLSFHPFNMSFKKKTTVFPCLTWSPRLRWLQQCYYGTSNIASKLIAETSCSYAKNSIRWKGCSICPRDRLVRMWWTRTHPSWNWKKTLPITASYLLNRNVLAVPGTGWPSPCCSTGWGVTAWGAALLERARGDQLTRQQCPGSRKGQLVMEFLEPVSWWRWLFASAWCLLGHTCNTMCGFGSHSTGRTLISIDKEWAQQRAPRLAGALVLGAGLEKRWIRGRPGSTPCIYGQVTGGTEPWPSQGPGPGTCDTCHKLKRGRFWLGVRKSFFITGAVEHWCRLPREAGKPPSSVGLCPNEQSSEQPGLA